MAQLVTEKRHQGIVHGLAWSPDGKLLASAASPMRSNGNSVHPVSFWDPETGKRVKTYTGLPADPENVWWSPDGIHIAGLAWNGVLQVWNWATGKVLFEQSFPRRGSPNAWASWSPDGAYLATAGSDPRITIWDTQTWQPVSTYPGHAQARSGPGCFAWSPDGSRIASYGYDDTVQVWDSKTCQELWRIHAANSGVCWSPDGKYLATSDSHQVPGQLASWDVTVWDMTTYESLHILTAFLLFGGAREIAWSPTLPYVAIPCGYANRLYLFDPLAGKLMRTLQVFWACVPTWSPDGQLLACGSGRSRVQVWRVTP